MSDLLTKSLAQIVNTNHLAAAVFEKYHLDFCCNGKRSLQQACAENELPLDNVLSDLEKTKPGNSCSIPVDFNRFSLALLADYIVLTHHSYVKKEMPTILDYLQKVVSKHGVRHPEMKMITSLFISLKEEMEYHMQKEETVLFPRIKEIEKQLSEGKEIIINNTYLSSPIHNMETEHDHAGHLLSDIRKLTNDYNPPADACTTYRLCYASLQAFELDLHQHVHLENNILFPKALKLFEQPNQCSLN